MIILNFSHSLTERQEEQIKVIMNISDKAWKDSKIMRINCYLDIEKSLPDQVDGILSQIPDDVWTDRILVVPPPIAHSAILIMIGISSKCGYFPEAIRIKRKKGSNPPEYVVAEIIQLQAFKDRMRAKRFNKKIYTRNTGEKNNG